MSSSTVRVTILMDSEIKAQAEALYAALGMDMSVAINLFVRQCLRDGRLPFQPTPNVPNEETIRAVEEVNEMLRSGNFKRYTVDEAFEELERGCSDRER